RVRRAYLSPCVLSRRRADGLGAFCVPWGRGSRFRPVSDEDEGRDMKPLVLNAGYEPLSIVPFTRAVVLVLTGKATVLAAEDVPVRSEHVSLDQPSVILLTRYVRPPNSRRVSLSRRGVLRRDNHRCA